MLFSWFHLTPCCEVRRRIMYRQQRLKVDGTVLAPHSEIKSGGHEAGAIEGANEQSGASTASTVLWMYRPFAQEVIGMFVLVQL